MDLRSLRYFVATVEAGTVSGAAQRCHIAQPSISNAILQLESEFNKTLFVRQAKGVVPTEAGLKFYQQAKALLTHADEMRRHLLQPETQERVSLYVPPTVSSAWLADWWQTLQSVASTYQWVMVNDIEAADVQLQVVTAPQESRYFIPLQEQTYHLLCHAGNPLCFERQISFEQLLPQPFIERRYCELREVFMQFQSRSATALNIVAQVDNEDWALALVSAGVGVTFAPLGPQKLPENVAAVPLTRIAGVALVTRTLGLRVPLHHPQEDSLLALCRQLATASTAV